MAPTRMDKVAQRVSALIDLSEKSHREIADEIGYTKPNIIAMFKMGVTKVPIVKIGPLAKALNADAAHMMRLALETYMPESYEAIKDVLGDILSADERKVVKAYRKASHDGKEALTNDREDAIEECLAKAFSKK
jgi:hypothetical protein